MQVNTHQTRQMDEMAEIMLENKRPVVSIDGEEGVAYENNLCYLFNRKNKRENRFIDFIVEDAHEKRIKTK